MPDGHIYTLPKFGEMGFTYDGDGKEYQIGAIPQFSAINTKWLEAVGMEMPTTVDELHDVLVAFKDKDPNGNGQADEIPHVLHLPREQRQLVRRHGHLHGSLWLHRL